MKTKSIILMLLTPIFLLAITNLEFLVAAMVSLVSQ